MIAQHIYKKKQFFSQFTTKVVKLSTFKMLEEPIKRN